MTITNGVDLGTDSSLPVVATSLDPEMHELLSTRLNRKKIRVDRFLTTAGGGLTAAGIGGPIVGRGADLMLIDDYIKNVEEAMSQAGHKKIFEWFKGTAYTRLEPGASLVVLATRWDFNDLIAMLVNELPHENWTVINLPMYAMANDPLGRELGEVLWPERYPLEACQRIEKTLGPYWFAAQCQQDPKESMSGADLGEKLRYIEQVDLPPATEMDTIRSWDLAATEGGGDNTAGVKMSKVRKTGEIIIQHISLGKRSSGKNKEVVEATAFNDGHGVKIWMEQEPGSSGKTVITDYDKLLSTYLFKGERATGPIEVRAGPFTAAIEAGNVYVLRGSWNKPFKSELNGFPDGLNDDQIVAAALAYNKLVLGARGAVTWGRDVIPNNVYPIKGTETDQHRHDIPQRRLTW